MRRSDLAGALATLERIPMDLISWKVVNSDRKDVVDGKGTRPGGSEAGRDAAASG